MASWSLGHGRLLREAETVTTLMLIRGCQRTVHLVVRCMFNDLPVNASCCRWKRASWVHILEGGNGCWDVISWMVDVRANETLLSIVDLSANEALLSIVDASAIDTLLSIVDLFANETLLWGDLPSSGGSTMPYMMQHICSHEF